MKQRQEKSGPSERGEAPAQGQRRAEEPPSSELVDTHPWTMSPHPELIAVLSRGLH